jgi:hypothetical protein
LYGDVRQPVEDDVGALGEEFDDVLFLVMHEIAPFDDGLFMVICKGGACPMGAKPTPTFSDADVQAQEHRYSGYMWFFYQYLCVF